MPTHFLISPQIWAREKGPGSSRLLKNIKAANEANKTEDDPDNDRCWILQPDWLFKSIESKEMLAEHEYDYEKLEGAARTHNRKVAELERKGNGGKSKYAPGQRRKIKLEQQRAADLAREEAAMRQEEQERQAQIAEAKQQLDAQMKPMSAGSSGVVGAQGGSGVKAAPTPSTQDLRTAAEAAIKRLSQSQEAAKKASQDDNEPDIFDSVKSKKVTGQHKSSPKKSGSSSGTRPPNLAPQGSSSSSGTKGGIKRGELSAESRNSRRGEHRADLVASLRLSLPSQTTTAAVRPTTLLAKRSSSRTSPPNLCTPSLRLLFSPRPPPSPSFGVRRLPPAFLAFSDRPYPST
ncbi:hypothetical protein BCR35DRAFT_126180 [Leucosporidium creatinivorum]|uniref:BRCT domain-containing protein n=1 Tax=Leucosporidium creatinivorum TaxID=106004 RepID=A0A1Y2EVM8_9BASI|nr:hypothetical protein BCR35DRAFT_126180 [Leucosporidium creatinivorum]